MTEYEELKKMRENSDLMVNGGVSINVDAPTDDIRLGNSDTSPVMLAGGATLVKYFSQGTDMWGKFHVVIKTDDVFSPMHNSYFYCLIKPTLNNGQSDYIKKYIFPTKGEAGYVLDVDALMKKGSDVMMELTCYTNDTPINVSIEGWFEDKKEVVV